jgi:hypothetical protein
LKSFVNTTLVLLAVLTALPLASAHAQGRKNRRQQQRQVKVFFSQAADGDAAAETGNPWNLRPVWRTVNAGAPLRPAILAFLDGPTRAEAARGLTGIDYGIRLVDVRRKGSRVRADFHMPRGAAFSGDMSPAIFRDGVERTIKQFDGVKTVIVCLDNVLDFWSESGEPPKRCPKL